MAKDMTLPRTQRILGWICMIPLSVLIVALLRWRRGYRIERHAEIRRQFREITERKQPLLVCANHLTLIDSVILIWAFASLWRYAIDYRLFCWNLPAIENARKHRSWRVITYLSKCLPIDRFGSAAHTGSVLAKICNLLRRGECAMLFPEGTRSRTGRIDLSAVTYGVGRILQEVPDCRVLCVYLRGKGQETFSNFPEPGEVFEIDLAVINPTSAHVGRRGARDLSHQIVEKLKAMEEQHFANKRSLDDR